ncbi:MAG: alpha/beta hydrolase [Parvularculaceae bacterium]|nr:alpha/beta hydrolase [Parvularculaceae bacterium]
MMIETKKLTFPSARGETLAGVLDLPDGPPAAFALFAHCFSCSKDLRAAREIARELCAHGVAVLRFDFEGLGASEGDFADTNFSSNVDDLVAAAGFLRRAYQAPSILIGHSLGGAAVLVAAAQIPETRAVATIGAPADAAHVTHQFDAHKQEIEKTGSAAVRLAGRPFIIKQQFLDDLGKARVVEAAASLRRPLLVLHAPRDQTVGIENAARLFEAARHPKSFISLDDADHLLTSPQDARYAAAIIAAWAARYTARPAETPERREDAAERAPDP